MTNEMGLLCELSRVRLDDQARLRAFELLQKPLDWPAFAKAASFHGVVPLVFPRLKAEFKALVPDLQFKILQAEYSSLVRVNWFLFGKLFSFYRALTEAGITVIAYKGALTATAFYGDLFSRQFSDIDLLVSPHEFDKAYRVLSERGLQPFLYEMPLESNFIASRVFQQLSFEVAMLEPGTPLEIDLHWRVRPKHVFPLEFDELLLWSEEVDIEGQLIRTLSAEALLVMHCLISSTELWQRLTWISDTAHILAKNDLDWGKIEKLAVRLDCLPTVTLGIALAHAAYQVAVPEQFLQRTQSKEIVELTDFTIKNLGAAETLGSTRGAHWRFDLALRPGLLRKLSFIFDYVVQPDFRSWMRLRLPDNLLAAYYPLQVIWQLQGLFGRSLRLLFGGR